MGIIILAGVVLLLVVFVVSAMAVSLIDSGMETLSESFEERARRRRDRW